MKQKTIIVQNKAGIHARPAALIVQEASQFDSDIFLEKDSEKINAKSIMGIITLGASYKSEVIVSAEGGDEDEALNTIVALFEKKFEEK